MPPTLFSIDRRFAVLTLAAVLVLLALAALLIGSLSAAAQSGAPTRIPDVPDTPVGKRLFVEREGQQVFYGAVELDWNDVPQAASYQVQLYDKVKGEGVMLPATIEHGGHDWAVTVRYSGSSAVVSNLPRGYRSYYFRVRATNALGSSEYC